MSDKKKKFPESLFVTDADPDISNVIINKWAEWWDQADDVEPK